MAITIDDLDFGDTEESLNTVRPAQDPLVPTEVGIDDLDFDDTEIQPIKPKQESSDDFGLDDFDLDLDEFGIGTQERPEQQQQITRSPEGSPVQDRVSPNEIFGYLKEKGIPDNHAKGMIANIWGESNFQPSVIEPNVANPGLGLFQYTEKTRKKKFLNNVPDWKSNWKGQIDHALTEGLTKSFLRKKFDTPEEASEWFTKKWERPKHADEKAKERSARIGTFLTDEPIEGQSQLEPVQEASAPTIAPQEEPIAPSVEPTTQPTVAPQVEPQRDVGFWEGVGKNIFNSVGQIAKNVSSFVASSGKESAERSKEKLQQINDRYEKALEKKPEDRSRSENFMVENYDRLAKQSQEHISKSTELSNYIGEIAKNMDVGQDDPDLLRKNQEAVEFMTDDGLAERALKSPLKFTKAILNTTASQAGLMATASLPGGQTILIASESGRFEEEIKDQSEGTELDPEIVSKYATMFGLISGGIETYTDRIILSPGKIKPIKKLIDKAKGKVLKKAGTLVGGLAISSILEGLEEAGQSYLQDALTAAAYADQAEKLPSNDPNKGKLLLFAQRKIRDSKDIPSKKKDFLLGALIGTAMGAPSTAKNLLKKEETVAQTFKQELETKEKKLEQIEEQAVENNQSFAEAMEGAKDFFLSPAEMDLKEVQESVDPKETVKNLTKEYYQNTIDDTKDLIGKDVESLSETDKSRLTLRLKAEEELKQIEQTEEAESESIPIEPVDSVPVEETTQEAPAPVESEPAIQETPIPEAETTPQEIVPETAPIPVQEEIDTEVQAIVDQTNNEVLNIVETEQEQSKVLKLGGDRRKAERRTIESIKDNMMKVDPTITEETAFKLADIASRHPVTGLPSEPAMNSYIKNNRDNIPEGSKMLAVSIDLNAFKRVNDSYGQLSGDQVMEATQTLMNRIAKKYNIEHFHRGGDEAAIMSIVPQDDIQNVAQALNEIKQEINETKFFSDKIPTELPIGISMGVAFDEFSKADEMLKKKSPNSIMFSEEIKNELGIEDVIGEDVNPLYDQAGLAKGRSEDATGQADVQLQGETIKQPERVVRQQPTPTKQEVRKPKKEPAKRKQPERKLTPEQEFAKKTIGRKEGKLPEEKEVEIDAKKLPLGQRPIRNVSQKLFDAGKKEGDFRVDKKTGEILKVKAPVQRKPPVIQEQEGLKKRSEDVIKRLNQKIEALPKAGQKVRKIVQVKNRIKLTKQLLEKKLSPSQKKQAELNLRSLTKSLESLKQEKAESITPTKGVPKDIDVKKDLPENTTKIQAELDASQSRFRRNVDNLQRKINNLTNLSNESVLKQRIKLQEQLEAEQKKILAEEETVSRFLSEKDVGEDASVESAIGIVEESETKFEKEIGQRALEEDANVNRLQNDVAEQKRRVRNAKKKETKDTEKNILGFLELELSEHMWRRKEFEEGRDPDTYDYMEDPKRTLTENQKRKLDSQRGAVFLPSVSDGIGAMNKLYQGTKSQSKNFFEFINDSLSGPRKAQQLIGQQFRRLHGKKNALEFKAQSEIVKITNTLSKLDSELVPFLIEKTGVPDKLGRKDLQERFEEYQNDRILKKRLDQVVVDVKEYFDTVFQFMENGDKKFNAQQIEDYVTHIWGADNKNMSKAKDFLTQKFKTENPFSNQRFFKTYEDGINSGFIPKNLSIINIMDIHAKYAIRAISNQQFIDLLKSASTKERPLIALESKIMGKNGQLKPEFRDFKKTDNNNFAELREGLSPTGKSGLQVDPFYYHKDVEPAIKVMFDTFRPGPIFTFFRNINGFYKSLMLNYSLFHHNALIETSVATLGLVNTAKIAGDVKSMWKTMGDKNYIVLKDNDLTKDFIEHNGQIGSIIDTDRAFVDKGIQKVHDFMKKSRIPGSQLVKAFQFANDKNNALLWDFLHNTLKVQAYEQLVNKHIRTNPDVKSRAEEDVLKVEVAQMVNDTFGGQSWETFMYSPKALAWANQIMLSPDWFVSTMRQALSATGLGTASNTPTGKALRRKMGRQFWLRAAIYFGVGMNLLNMTMRAKDEEDEEEKKGIKRKISLMNRIFSDKKDEEDAWWKYTMFGNTKGHGTHIFNGRFGTGEEKYMRFGKQFRELPEMFWDFHKNEFSPISATVKKMGGKLAPMWQLSSLVAFHSSIGGFKNMDLERSKHEDDFIEYSAKLFWEGLKLSRPFVIQGIANDYKEFTWTDLFAQSSKGMSFHTAKQMMIKSITNDFKHQDKILEGMKRNKIDIQQVIKVSYSELEKRIKEDAKKSAKYDVNWKPKTVGELIEKEKNNANQARAHYMSENIDSGKALIKAKSLELEQLRKLYQEIEIKESDLADSVR